MHSQSVSLILVGVTSNVKQAFQEWWPSLKLYTLMNTVSSPRWILSVKLFREVNSKETSELINL